MPARNAFAAMLALLVVPTHTRAQSDKTSGTMFYANCMAAADIISGLPPPSDPQAATRQLEKSSTCFGAITALMNLESFFRPEFAMCPPQNSKISLAQMTLAIADYLKTHPEKLNENFYALAAFALHQTWPCPDGGR